MAQVIYRGSGRGVVDSAGQEFPAGVAIDVTDDLAESLVRQGFEQVSDQSAASTSDQISNDAMSAVVAAAQDSTAGDESQ